MRYDLSVTFEVHRPNFPDWVEIPESAISDEDIDHYRALQHPNEQPEGAVVVEVTGQPRVAIGDDLWAVAHGLCFTLVRRAIEEQAEALLYSRYNSEGYVIMIPGPIMIWLMGNQIPATLARGADLLPALYQCGVRIIELLERIGGSEEVVEELRSVAARTRDALSNRIQ